MTVIRLPDVVKTMRIGYTAGMYAAPLEVDSEQLAEWHLIRSIEIGARALQLMSLPSDPGRRLELGARAVDADVELEGATRSIFVPLGEKPSTLAPELRAELAAAKDAGMTVVRGGYGRLTLETSRFDRSRPLAEHRAHVVACLSAAADVAADIGVPLAIENHCDFTGKQLVEILDEVDSPLIGCALDTGNAYTVYADPADDIAALAPYAVTTHMKDMRLEPSPFGGTIPLLPYGCPMGDGNVDIAATVAALAHRSPDPHGLHLIVETGWERADGLDPAALAELRRERLVQGVRWLQELIADHPSAANGEIE